MPGSLIKDPTASLYSTYSVGFRTDISLPSTPTDEEEGEEEEGASEHSLHLFTVLGQLFQ
jgi:hypothetical protein